MKALHRLAVLGVLTFSCIAMPPVAISGDGSSVAAKEPVNYTIRIESGTAKKSSSVIQLVTAEGQFNLDTVSGNTKINDSDVPNTTKVSGAIAELNAEKGRLNLFLGRTIPYVTGTSTGPAANRFSSYSQLSVGLNCTVIVSFGKPLVVQTDDSGTVTVLVTRGN